VQIRRVANCSHLEVSLYRSTVGDKFEFALPDEYCEMLDINIGDMLLFTILVGRQVSIDKHSEQDLSDAEIEIACN